MIGFINECGYCWLVWLIIYKKILLKLPASASSWWIFRASWSAWIRRSTSTLRCDRRSVAAVPDASRGRTCARDRAAETLRRMTSEDEVQRRRRRSNVFFFRWRVWIVWTRAYSRWKCVMLIYLFFSCFGLALVGFCFRVWVSWRFEFGILGLESSVQVSGSVFRVRDLWF